jgi:hypothetical protein
MKELLAQSNIEELKKTKKKQPTNESEIHVL